MTTFGHRISSRPSALWVRQVMNVKASVVRVLPRPIVCARMQPRRSSRGGWISSLGADGPEQRASVLAHPSLMVREAREKNT